MEIVWTRVYRGTLPRSVVLMDVTSSYGGRLRVAVSYLEWVHGSITFTMFWHFAPGPEAAERGGLDGLDGLKMPLNGGKMSIWHLG